MFSSGSFMQIRKWHLILNTCSATFWKIVIINTGISEVYEWVVPPYGCMVNNLQKLCNSLEPWHGHLVFLKRVSLQGGTMVISASMWFWVWPQNAWWAFSARDSLHSFFDGPNYCCLCQWKRNLSYKSVKWFLLCHISKNPMKMVRHNHYILN